MSAASDSWFTAAGFFFGLGCLIAYVAGNSMETVLKGIFLIIIFCCIGGGIQYAVDKSKSHFTNSELLRN
jgi:hypothetical protein